ncbi:MAG: ABC transporter ATP-binding protein [Candidatus Cloacimonetes bacterium]|nr:ABC transporter ATP-binding protein [Candidatus Cloacimonadota bacterium]
MIKLNGVSVSYQDVKVLKNLSLNFSKGEFCALLGPNGVGKSTLLHTILGVQPMISGSIFIAEKELGKWQRKELAKLIAIIPQDFQLQFDYTVKDIVLMGRFPYSTRWQNYTHDDYEKVEKILLQLDLNSFHNKLYSKLSGGERRRVSIARALAQETDILLMDEAFANLDINHQLEIMQILSQINKEHDKLIILISHNINLASEYCRRVILLKQGKVLADGAPQNILNSQNLEKLYNTKLQIINNPVSGKPNFIYQGQYED